MSANTIAQNRSIDVFEGQAEIWLFGYGSLVFKADFPYEERHPVRVRGWERRLWQGSHDHRGTEEAPGRVATLVPSPGAVCAGVAYRISRDLLDHLDYREKNGYLRQVIDMSFDDRPKSRGLAYIATESNAAWLGPSTEQDIARHVAAAEGPSGRNDDYVLRLAEALRDMSAGDKHVFAVERYLRLLRPRRT